MQTTTLCEPLHFRFYDVGVRLASDCPSYFDLFAQLYERFQVEGNSFPALPTVHATVITGHTTGMQPALWLDGEKWPLVDAIALRDHLFETIFAALAAQVRRHILVHAAVAERNGGAILIVGDSQHGKSSLALGLLRRGFHLLSDELAAIDRRDGTVHPFPRKLRVTPRSLGLVGQEARASELPLWLGKYLLDLEKLQPSAISAPLPIRDIIVLSDPAMPAGAQQHTVTITVERIDKCWLDAVARLDGISALHVDRSGHLPTLHIQTQNKVALLTEVEALCYAHRILCLETQKRAPYQPSFAQAPQLVPLRTSLAVMEMLRHFQGAHTSVILREEHRGSATNFYVEMADLVQNARCHRLFVGHYEQTLDLICSVSH
jgi:hypothetical protein